MRKEALDRRLEGTHGHGEGGANESWRSPWQIRSWARLMMEHNVGVAMRSIYELKTIDRYFFEDSD